MTLWGIISSILPWTGLATLFAAIHFAKKSAASRAALEAAQKDIARFKEAFASAENERIKLANQIKHMSEVYSEMNSRRIAAEAKADSFQMAAAELARQTAANPDADAAAREVAKHLQELLNGT